MIKNEKYATLLELAKEFGVNKSSMIYYYQLGFFSPEMTFSKTNVFDRAKAVKTWKTVLKLREEGKTLNEIREIFSVK